MPSIPQFAYASVRQTSDALDRVLSHCAKIRNKLKDHHRNVFRARSGIKRTPLAGGLQVSLDMTKAFDKLPRGLLRAALERVQAPEALITLVLYIHDAACIVMLLKAFTMVRKKGERLLCVKHTEGLLTLPLRRVHDYLGVKIGYANFERATVQHRMTLAWTAFHRLHSLLKHQLIPLRKRILLWQSCVWSVASYGLSATGLDPHSAQQLVSGVMRQLRIVACSPAHISHTTNAEVLRNTGVKHPMQWLSERSEIRLAACQRDVAHLQPGRGARSEPAFKWTCWRPPGLGC